MTRLSGISKLIAGCAAVLLAVSSLAVADVTVMDQIGPNPADTALTGIFASQDFEAANDAFDIGVIDDFSYDGIDSLTKVEFVGGMWNGPAQWANVTGYRVEFYSSAAAATASLTGDVGSFFVGLGSANVDLSGYPGDVNSRALVTLDLGGVVLAGGAGQRWIAIMPEMGFGAGGQVGVAGSNFAGSFPGGLNAAQVNPAGGFGFPGNFQPIDPGANAAYRIWAADGIPEPTAFAALALVGLGLVTRRRRD